MTDQKPTDARTSPAAVWKVLEHLKGDALAAWRMADVPGRASVAERKLDEPYPFGWYAVSYSDELAPGELKSLRYFSREMVLWRGEDGQARMLDAYCRHFGAHMGHGGRVNGNDLECPFHAWQYDGTGAVTKIPYSSTIPNQARQANCVQSWPIAEHSGFVWLWYHPENAAPLWEVPVIPEVGSPDWTPFQKFQWRIFTSARHPHDNTVDTAHFLYVHRTANFPDNEVTFKGHEMDSISRAKMGTPRGEVDGSISSTSPSPSVGVVRFQGISETLSITTTTPVEKDELHVRFSFIQPKTEAEGPSAGLAQAMIRNLCKQFDQDKVIWDHMRYEPKPLMCDGDGPIMLARYRYDQFLSDEAFEKAKGKVRTLASKAKV